MCDVEKYSQMYDDIKQLQPEDTLQLILEAKTEEEQEFFECYNPKYKWKLNKIVMLY